MPHTQVTWTPELVADHLEEAVSTTRKLPPVRVQGYFNLWPGIIHTPNELMLMDARPMRIKAMPDAIERLEQTFEWMTWLTVQERRLVWRRAARVSWKTICWEFGFSHSTASRKWKHALMNISKKLNTSCKCS